MTWFRVPLSEADRPSLRSAQDYTMAVLDKYVQTIWWDDEGMKDLAWHRNMYPTVALHSMVDPPNKGEFSLCGGELCVLAYYRLLALVAQHNPSQVDKLVQLGRTAIPVQGVRSCVVLQLVS